MAVKSFITLATGQNKKNVNLCYLKQKTIDCKVIYVWETKYILDR
jgi:hypothetical protein